ncbi:hypothetical protein DICA3_A08592 [Diutina catenulata]
MAFTSLLSGTRNPFKRSSNSPSPSPAPQPVPQPRQVQPTEKASQPIVMANSASANSSKSSGLSGPSNETPISSDFDSPSSSPSLAAPRISPSDSTGSPRRMSDKMKATPSTLHRQSRVFSPGQEVSRTPTLTQATHVLQQKSLNDSLEPALRPIVTLLQAQRLRIYNIGVFQVPGYTDDGAKVWIEVEAKLTGNELAIWRPEDDQAYTEFKPKYINIVDAKIEVVKGGQTFEMIIKNDYTNENDLLVRFVDAQDYVRWLAAFYLANFEYISLNEAYTAVILSTRGRQLSDIHVLLAQKKRFPTEEWCNLRLPQISSRWIKVFCVTTPGDSKKLGRIEIYASDKISKKNLILYVSKLDHVYNVYPESPSMIDFNAMMKLNGEIYVNRNFEHLFTGDNNLAPPRGFLGSMKRSDSWHSLSSLGKQSPPSSPRAHRRTDSGSSTTQFFQTPSSPMPAKNRSRSSTLDSKLNPLKKKGSSSSGTEDEPTRTSSYIRKHWDEFAPASYMYLMPITHPGVPAIETMIRNLIQTIDSFRLYGRPRHLNSDRQDPTSFLFGLPSLPHYQYLSRDASTRVVDKKLGQAVSDGWSEREWRSQFKTVIREKMQSGTYRGHGDIARLYENLDYSVFLEQQSPVLPEEGYSDAGSGEYTLSPPYQSRSATPVSRDYLAPPIEFDKVRHYTASPLSNSYR